jgi:hypothetical protein
MSRKHLVGLVFGFCLALACAAGQIGPTGDIFSVNTSAPLAGGSAQGDVTLSLAPCGTNEIYKWNGSAWVCAADATGGGISGLTATRIPVATSGTTIADSVMTETSYASNPYGISISRTSSAVAHSGVSPRVILAEELGSFDTTSAGGLVMGVKTTATASRSAGSNDLTNVAVYATAANGQFNYSFLGISGVSENAGPITEAGVRVFSLAGDGLITSGVPYSTAAKTVNAASRQRAVAGDWGIEVRADDIGLTDNCTNGQVLKYDDGSGGTLHTGEWDCAADSSNVYTAGSPLTLASGQFTLGLCSANQILQMDVTGTNWGCMAVPGGGGISGLTTGTLPIATSATTIGNSLLTFATGTFTATGNLAIAGAGNDLTVADVALINGNLNAEAQVQLDNVGDITWSSTGTAGGAVDVGLARGVAGQLVINDGDGIATADLRDGLSRTWSASNAGVAFKMINTGRVEWSSAATFTTTDAAIGRNAAGVLEVNSGTAATYRDIIARTHFGGVAASTSFKSPSTGRIEWSSTTAHTGASDTGLERSAAGSLVINDGAGVAVADMRDLNARSVFSNIAAGTAFKAVSTGRLEWSSTTLIGGASDVGIERSAAGALVVNDGAGIATADLRDITTRTHFGDNAGVVFKTVLGGQIQWSSTTAIAGAATVGIGTNGANRLEVNNGTAGTFANLIARDITANQNLTVSGAVSGGFDVKGNVRDTTTAPTVTACGTGASSSVGKNGFTITIGSTNPTTTCTVTFPSAFSAAPSCVVSPRDGTKAGLITYTTSTAAWSITAASATIHSTVWDVICIGH